MNPYIWDFLGKAGSEPRADTVRVQGSETAI